MPNTHGQAGIRSPGEMAAVIDRVAAAMAGEGYPEADVFGMRLALEEAVVNAVKHGHGGDVTKEVLVRYSVTAEQTVAEVEDQGPGFDPKAVPDPLAAENLEKPSGRGLLLMRASTTSCLFNERGNRVTLLKDRSGR